MVPQQALEKYFGFREFREPQGEVISAILNKEDVFVVMPTGGGKSLCYQLPAILLDGVTVVVSPLVALMKDQVDVLAGRGLSARRLTAQLRSPSSTSAFVGCGRQFKLVHRAGTVRSRSFLEALGQVTIALFAVDALHINGAMISARPFDLVPCWKNLVTPSRRIYRDRNPGSPNRYCRTPGTGGSECFRGRVCPPEFAIQ
jgi:hypothetical protein